MVNKWFIERLVNKESEAILCSGIYLIQLNNDINNNNTIAGNKDAELITRYNIWVKFDSYHLSTQSNSV